MDEDMIAQAAMAEAMGGGMGMDPMAGDPMAGGAGYTPVMVPDSVLPAVMELVSQAEGGGMGSPGMGGGMPPADMGMGMPF